MRTKPSVLLDSVLGAKRSRWFPHEELHRVAHALSVFGTDFGFPWEILDPADARECLPDLQEGFRGLAKFVKMIEAIAEGDGPTSCAECGEQFYPLRSDAKYCKPKCRTSAHRKRHSQR